MRGLRRSVILAAICSALIVLLSAGCAERAGTGDTRSGTDETSAPQADYGPMAIIETKADEPRYEMESRAEGIIEITERCVYLKESGSNKRQLLIWDSLSAAWDGEKNAIVFLLGVDEPTIIQDGDKVVFGGGSFETGKDVDWLNPPHESCSGKRWKVDSM